MCVDVMKGVWSIHLRVIGCKGLGTTLKPSGFCRSWRCSIAAKRLEVSRWCVLIAERQAHACRTVSLHILFVLAIAQSLVWLVWHGRTH